VTWAALVWRNLLRRPARTGLTAAGVGLGVALIVALLAITSGVHRTADDLIHVGRSDFGVFQGDVSDLTRSLLPESLAASIERSDGVADVAKVKLLVDHGRLVFGLDPEEFAYKRLVLLRGRRGAVLAGDHSGKDVGDEVQVGKRMFTVDGVYHSGDRFEDLGVVLPLREVETIAGRPREVTSVGVVVRLGNNARAVARQLEARFPGTVAITEPGQAIKVDTSSRLIISTGWIISILALIVGGIGVTNTMAMSVFERVREIGILRAVGWRTQRIAGMIVSEAIAICLLALGVGCGLGVLAAEVFVDHSALSDLITPAFTAGTFAWGLAFALGVAVIGAAYPTWRAVRLEPIEALRRE
jgi:putative ABC transport system permease protein